MELRFGLQCLGKRRVVRVCQGRQDRVGGHLLESEMPQPAQPQGVVVPEAAAVLADHPGVHVRLDLGLGLLQEGKQDGLPEVQRLLDPHRRLGHHADPLLDQLHPIEEPADDGHRHRAVLFAGLARLPLGQGAPDAAHGLAPLAGVQPPALQPAEVDGHLQERLVRVLAFPDLPDDLRFAVAGQDACPDEPDVELADHPRHHGRQGPVQFREQQVVGGQGRLAPGGELDHVRGVIAGDRVLPGIRQPLGPADGDNLLDLLLRQLYGGCHYTPPMKTESRSVGLTPKRV